MLTRFGPLFQIERGRPVRAGRHGGAEERFDEAVTAQVNAHPEIAHNYRRDHALNMWFVLGTENAGAMCGRHRTHRGRDGLAVLAFPKEREFFVELKLPDERRSPWRLTISTAP